MSARPPKPLVQAYVVCEQIYRDQRTGHLILLRPVKQLLFPSFPGYAEVAVYMQLTSGHGRYDMALHVRDTDGEVRWGIDWRAEPIELGDPLATQEFAFWDLKPVFREPGRYEVVILANGEELGSQVIWANPR